MNLNCDLPAEFLNTATGARTEVGGRVRCIPAVLLGAISGLVLVIAGCKFNEQEHAQMIDPREVAGPAPRGVPEGEGRMYRVSGLHGLIPHGDEVLVQVIAADSREGVIWREHEEQVRAHLAAGHEAPGKKGERHRFLELDKPGENSDYATYYLEPTNPPMLRAHCVGLFSFDRPNIPCYFRYRVDDKIIKFTLDKEAVVSGAIEEIESVIFEQRRIPRAGAKREQP